MEDLRHILFLNSDSNNESEAFIVILLQIQSQSRVHIFLAGVLDFQSALFEIVRDHIDITFSFWLHILNPETMALLRVLEVSEDLVSEVEVNFLVELRVFESGEAANNYCYKSVVLFSWVEFRGLAGKVGEGALVLAGLPLSGSARKARHVSIEN